MVNSTSPDRPPAAVVPEVSNSSSSPRSPSQSEVGSVVVSITPVPSTTPTPISFPTTRSSSSRDLATDLAREAGRGEGLAYAVELGSVDEVGAIRKRRTGGLAPPGRPDPPRRMRAKFREDAQFVGEGSDAEEEDPSFFPPAGWIPDVACLPQPEGENVFLAGEDYSRLREWLLRLPRGRSPCEPSLYPLQDTSLLQGGTVGIIRGEGTAELGSATVDIDGNVMDWDAEVDEVLEWAREQNDWSNIELSDLLPMGCRRLLKEGEDGEVGQARIDLIPRAIWKPAQLTRTSSERCAGMFMYGPRVESGTRGPITFLDAFIEGT